MIASAEPRFARWPGGVNAAVLGVILVLVTILGVRVAQTPPPQIAAFAPQLQSNHSNSALSGTLAGPGNAAPNGVAATPTPTPTPTPSPSNAQVDTHAVRQCFGDPPRQTPDPQSPPCVPYYDPSSNNGGATSMGVTKDSIYVAYPDLGNTNCPADYPVEHSQDTVDFANYMNDHFEFYGRKIVLEDFCVSATSTPPAAAMQADATKVAQQLNPGIGVFASLEYAPVGGAAFYYYNQLAQDGVVSIDSDVMAQDYTGSYGPYEWSNLPSVEQFMTNMGALVCNRLAGQPQQYAGSPPPGASWGKVRSFRIVAGGASDGLTWNYQPLVAALGGCGLDTTVDHIQGGSSSNYTSEASRLSGQKCADGITTCPITTVLCVCGGPDEANLMNAAQQQGYFPEWGVTGQGGENYDSSSSSSGSNVGQSGYPASQLGHIIGITYENKIDAPASTFWYRALKEVDPGYTYGDNTLDWWNQYRYEQLMLLAAGIQAAGPDLTPQTFANGLYGIHWPDPGAGAAPYYQAHLGLSPSNHHWFTDAAAIWFDAQATNYTTGEPRTGSFCYSRGGQRSATWTDIAPLFYANQSCR